MHTGMLWFDNSPSSLSVKIQKAAGYYQKKYGHAVNLCLVNPNVDISEIGSPGDIDGISVRTSKFVLPDHLWLGVEEKQETEVRQLTFMEWQG